MTDGLKTDKAKTYVAGGQEFLYPYAGDERPPAGAKVLLLTVGGICTVGPWSDYGGYSGWAPLPKRNKDKELRSSAYGVARRRAGSGPSST